MGDDVSRTFVSITRLRLRSWRFLPAFFLQTGSVIAQARKADGFGGGALLRDRQHTYWTLTLWQDQEGMRHYMTSGAHLKVMPRLMDWCDEASVVHWWQDHSNPPNWTEAERRMRSEGRISKVRNPSPDHAEMRFAAPRTSFSVPIPRGHKRGPAL